jgi:hypothetical protein
MSLNGRMLIIRVKWLKAGWNIRSVRLGNVEHGVIPADQGK